jgi:glycosyltransferase involved in cell wall biosynthesis
VKPPPTSWSRPPLVSIILPTYNGSAYLGEAIESCRAQTYRNWELILVDDCSTDETPSIIADAVARDPRVSSIRHEVNRKLPAALNTGHAAAQGRYLLWMSDDNRFLPSAIEEMTNFLEQNQEVGLVYADCVIIDDHGHYQRDFPAQPPSRLAYLNALGPCFMYRRSVYEAVGGYDPEMLLAEDYDYWLRVYRKFEVAPLHRVLYQYRWHNQSLTSTTTSAAVRASVEKTLRRHLPHLHRSSRQDRARGWMVCAGAAARRWAPLQTMSAGIRAIRTAPAFSIGLMAKKLADLL